MLVLILLCQYLPLLFQIFINIKTEALVNLALLGIQGSVTAIVFFIEFVQFCRSTKSYVSSIWNLTDLAYVIINIAQIFFRFIFINKSVIADWKSLEALTDEAEILKQFANLDRALLVVNFLMLIISSFKIIVLLRMFGSIASLVQLLNNSFRDVRAFLIFLMMFLVVFGAFY